MKNGRGPHHASGQNSKLALAIHGYGVLNELAVGHINERIVLGQNCFMMFYFMNYLITNSLCTLSQNSLLER
jgi:hypothetical protein